MLIATKIAEKAESLNGRVYYVGGIVRDGLLGKINKDVDIEVHGITPCQLEEILDCFGTRLQIGKSFGVYGISGYDIDISMPRTEVPLGKGHKDFRVSVDPFLGTEKAACRRDFTVNALMQDVLTNEIVDHFGGKDDLKNKILRHVNDKTFTEDPLRVFRGAQFAARFGFETHKSTVELCKTVDVSSLPRERVFEELKKALLKAEKPSLFFEFLRQTEKLDFFFSELKALIGVPQPEKYHKEGDVWNHTMLVLDQAAAKREKAENKTGFMLSALCHDFGKAVCTTEENGAVHAYGHETLGLPIVKCFLNRITDEKNLGRYVLNMVELHMKPNMMADSRSSVKATNNMFDQAVSPSDLMLLAACDNLGSITAEERPSREPFLSERYGIFTEYMSRPFVMGKDLIEAGLLPNESFTAILAYAHKLRLAGVDKASALKQTLNYAAELNRRK